MLAALAPLAIILIALILMFKRVDVRLSLGISAAALFLIAGKLPQLFVLITRPLAKVEFCYAKSILSGVVLAFMQEVYSTNDE